jgi:hypothetical protein
VVELAEPSAPLGLDRVAVRDSSSGEQIQDAQFAIAEAFVDGDRQ